MSRTWLTPLKWLAVFGLVGVLFGGAYLIHVSVRATEAGEKSDLGRAVEKEKDGVLKFADESARYHGLEWNKPDQITGWRESLTVYGRVVPNPAATVEIHAPVAGTLRLAPGLAWPLPGKKVRAGQTLALVEVRVGLLERLDLHAKLTEARARLRNAEEIRDRRRGQVQRQEKASPDTVTPLEREQAQVQLAEAQMQLDTARVVAELWQQALDALDGRDDPRSLAAAPALLGAAGAGAIPGMVAWAGVLRSAGARATSWSLPLIAPTDGEVTDLGATAETSVAADGLVFKLVDFHRVRVRLDLPAALLRNGPPPATIELCGLAPPPPALRGATNQPEAGPPILLRTAHLFGPAPEVEVSLQLARYWYHLDISLPESVSPGTASPASHDGVLWRPGLYVVGHVPSPEAVAQDVVAVPAAALLFHQGRTLVYVHKPTQPGRFFRREVRILGREGNRYLLAPRDITQDLEKVGIDPDEDEVVTAAAQILLSEEFRSDVDND